MNSVYDARPFVGPVSGTFYSSLAEREIEFRTPDNHTTGFYGIRVFEGQVFVAAEKENHFSLIIYDILGMQKLRFEVDIPKDDFKLMFKKYKPKHKV